MISYRDCHCPCHTGAVIVHVVACCDGIGSRIRPIPMHQAPEKQSGGDGQKSETGPFRDLFLKTQTWKKPK
jgi:hypothetical protein